MSLRSEDESRIVDSLKLTRSRQEMIMSYGSTSDESLRGEGRPFIYTLDSYDQFPVYVNCPRCDKRVLTHVDYKAGGVTWILTGMCLLLGCWCGCCLIPMMWKECKDVQHSCPDCGLILGLYKRGQK